MPDAMLFGAGWNGDVWTTEERANSLDLFHRPEMRPVSLIRDVPPIEYARFIVNECLINGAVYLIGYHGEKPTDEKIRWVYHHAERKPTRLD